MGEAGNIDSGGDYSENKWHAICCAVYSLSMRFGLGGKSLQNNSLRLNLIKVAEWMAELLERGVVQNHTQLAAHLYVSRTRVNQYLDLLQLPAKNRLQLKAVDTLTEYEIRSIVAMTPKWQARAIRRILARTD